MHYKAYIILAHQNPKQLGKLIKVLQDANTMFFVHLDKKTNSTHFRYLQEKENVFFVKRRVLCNWGGFSLVKATYNALYEAYNYLESKSLKSYHCILISGEDLPLKSNKEIQEFLENNKESSFFNYWELPYKGWWDGGMFRANKLYWFNVKKHKKLNYYVNNVIKRLNMTWCLPINRLKAFDKDFVVYGSSQWFIINKVSLKVLMKNKKVFKQLSKAFKFSFAPDELFFINFLKYIQKKEALKIKNEKTTFVVFEDTAPNPKFLSKEDLQYQFENSILFARKFNEKINPEAIKTLEKRIEH